VPAIRAVISDFGGVLTSPVLDAFLAVQAHSGIPLEALGPALGAIAERSGAHPLFELETGRLTEAAFLAELGRELTRQLDREVDMRDFGASLFAQLRPNHEFIDYMRSLRERGYRMAICTNNVREWEARWRALLPVDEIFHTVVDSAFVGVRKPDPRIYEVTLEQLGVSAAQALFIDDVELNCTAARELGMRAVWFRSGAQARSEIEAALGGASA
jgi:putative hydrolase of the HAD superfamily